VQAWAGPWPLDERWWDPPRARRLARFQVLTDDGVLRLLAVEHQQWWVQAVYG
jgi:protein ImuB